jgi:hypothetical protein
MENAADSQAFARDYRDALTRFIGNCASQNGVP